MKSIILFNQQPADIPLVLSLVEENKTSEITIVSIGIKNNYRFFTRILEKQIKIIFIPKIKNPNPFNPVSWIRAKCFLSSIFKKRFKEFKTTDVYFFAKGHDWISMYIVNKLMKNGNQILFCPAINIEINKQNNSIKDFFILSIYRWICNADIVFARNKFSRFLFYDNENIMNSEIDIKPYIYKKYSSSLKITSNTVLLIDSNMEHYNNINEYTETMLNLVKHILQCGYSIDIKEHPRLGATRGIKDYIKSEFPSYIPAEFIDCENYSYVLGLSSNALASLSVIYPNVYSILDLFQFKENNKKENYRNILTSSSKSNIRFIDNINFIK
ncbi:MAG: hypothetical protein A2033_15435 [Bacteroidetes bacterium GWA2_31_9]|nr:MAG: hypothetical protein A2033_15435 [Bacteroidetes bacterium GWA2_31_9]